MTERHLGVVHVKDDGAGVDIASIVMTVNRPLQAHLLIIRLPMYLLLTLTMGRN
ncbi:MAG: hypothetical protein IMF19_06565 [Proteobacteria bacterium]|nr:hypothetical protein [Pseudomonadota bacterium]